MAINATYKRYNGTGWEIFYFKTSAGQVGVSSTRKFITSSTTVNGKTFQLAADGSDSASVSIDAGDISAYTGDMNYLTDGMSVEDALATLDDACKAAYDHVPTNVLTTDSQLSASKLVGTISESNLPDYILGQLLYGGTLGASHLAALSSKAKTKLGVTSNTLELTNVGYGQSSPGHYIANEGIYYIVAVAQSFANLDLNVGDWLVATFSGWKKIDNTDAIASWCGLTGNITTAQAKTALGGSVASGDSGFATGGAVYTALANKLDSSPDFRKSGTYNYAWYIGYDTFRGTYYYFDGDSEEDPDFLGFIGVDTNDWDSEIIIQSVAGVAITSSDSIQDRTGAILKTENLTDKRTVQFPDKSGTLAMTSDVPTVTTSSTAPTGAKAGDIWFDTSN